MSKPVNTIRVGNVQLAVWENEAKGRDGTTNIVQSITIDKSYKDKDGNYKQTKSFKFSELLFLQVAIQEALKHKYLKESGKPQVETPKEF